MTRTVGIDLAADPLNTALAVIDWHEATARIGAVVAPADDDELVAACTGADKIGIDCPLGWPESFVQLLNEHRSGVIGMPAAPAKDWRASLAYRRTDFVVRERFGLSPLSVACDRIGHVALRGAELQRRLAEPGKPIDRSGAGRIVEVYPAATLKSWALPYRKYKGHPHADERNALVAKLADRAPWFDFAEHLERCQGSDHVLDAVVSALTARAAAIGKVRRPDAEDERTTSREGWIAVPDVPLEDLTSTRG